MKRDLNPEWNQVFAIGRDKVQGGALELSVWDAVMSLKTSSICSTIHASMSMYEKIKLWLMLMWRLTGSAG